jgi:Mg2+-importing ATPase
MNPFDLLLTALAALSYLSADAKAAVVIAVMVGPSTIIRFVQDGRSHRAAQGPWALVGNTASAIRRDRPARPLAARLPSCPGASERAPSRRAASLPMALADPPGPCSGARDSYPPRCRRCTPSC